MRRSSGAGWRLGLHCGVATSTMRGLACMIPGRSLDVVAGADHGRLGRVCQFRLVGQRDVSGPGHGPLRPPCVLAGVVGHITGKFTPVFSAADDLFPLFQAGRVRLRARVEQAGDVRVIGSWDAWAESTPLRATGQPGLWRFGWIYPGDSSLPFPGGWPGGRAARRRTHPRRRLRGRDAVVDVTEGQGTP